MQDSFLLDIPHECTNLVTAVQIVLVSTHFVLPNMSNLIAAFN